MTALPAVSVVGGGVVAERLRRVTATRHQLVGGDVGAGLVVLATPGPHAATAADLVRAGVHVVSTSGAVSDVRDLLDLDDAARGAGATLVVGAAVSPGLSGLLVRQLVGRMAACDELHHRPPRHRRPGLRARAPPCPAGLGHGMA